MSAVTNRADGQAAQADAQASSGNGVFKSIGGAVGNTVKGTGEDISNSYQGIKGNVGSKLSNTPSSMADTPLAPGTNTADVAAQATDKDTDSFTKSIENITGVKTSRLFPSDMIPSSDNLQATLEDFLGTLKRQVAAELKHCVEKYLAYLRNKYQLLDILLDLEGYIQRQVAAIRLKLQRKIRAELEKLFSQKLKMYQIALIRQKILGAIRKLCPKIPSKGTHSPTWIRRLQSDPTWQVVDGVTPLYVAAGSAPDISAAFDDPNNAGSVFENMIDDVMAQAVSDVQSQLSGFNNNAPGDFIDVESTADPDGSNYSVPSKQDTIIELITKFSAQGLHVDNIIERIVEELGESCRGDITSIVNEVCHEE
tara:strand:+ start:6312 stop:7412 length:1101 start_codon:yes stop_codon:yes gene_type:complete